MVLFEMIKYHTHIYPEDIPLRTEEVSVHFDVSNIKPSLQSSLHTEYSYGKRTFNSELISKFPSLISAQKNGVPQLWKNLQWAKDFSQFIFNLVGNQNPPSVIEIHPPFSDYSDIISFIELYRLFEQTIYSAYPNVQILIENRCGSIYKGGKFIISKHDDLEVLCQQIENNNLKLRIAYDIPQIYTAYNVKKPDMYIDILKGTQSLRSFIAGVHLWGKRKFPTGRKVAHCGDLNSYFENDVLLKNQFLSQFVNCFNDNVNRKMVLEVNSGHDDMISIISDLRQAGVQFI